MSKSLMGGSGKFYRDTTKMLQSPSPAIKNDQFPKGLMLLQFFESYVTFEECKYNFFGNKRSTIDTKFALIS